MLYDAMDDVRTVVADLRRLRVLPDDEARAMTDAVAARYVANRRATWWWTALRDDVRVERVAYEDASPWDELVGGLVPVRDRYVLAVLDDDADPSGAVEGSRDALSAVDEGTAMFEWVLTDADATFALFDTHHNELVLVTDDAFEREQLALALGRLTPVVEALRAALDRAERTGEDRDALLWAVDPAEVQQSIATARQLVCEALDLGLSEAERLALDDEINAVPFWSVRAQGPPPPLPADPGEPVLAAARILNQLAVSDDRWGSAHADLPEHELPRAFAEFFFGWSVLDRLAAAQRLMETARDAAEPPAKPGT